MLSFTFIVFSVLIWWAIVTTAYRLTTSKARSHCVLWPAQFGRKLVLGTRRKWPRPRRDRDVDNFSWDETETRRWYVWRPRRRDRDHNPALSAVGLLVFLNNNLPEMSTRIYFFDSSLWYKESYPQTLHDDLMNVQVYGCDSLYHAITKF